MKIYKALILAALALSSTTMSAKTAKEVPEALHYTLPRTVIKVSVEVRRNAHYAGMFSQYSRQMLGIAVPQEDTFSTVVTGVRIESAVEADLARWQSLSVPAGFIPQYLTFTPQGYVSGDVGIAPTACDSYVPMPAPRIADTDSLEASEGSARIVADKIFELRSARYAILVGDTDATYSGEALKTASDEIKKMEDARLADFIGEDEVCEAFSVFTVVPFSKERHQKLPVFEICDKAGLLPASSGRGREYFIEIDRPDMTQPDVDNPEIPAIICRIPAVCEVRLTDGVNTIACARIPVFQLGSEVRFPVIKKQ